MTLDQRAQQQGTGNLNLGPQAGRETNAIAGKPRVSLFPQTRYGIVDGELVEVLGQDDIPGMSPVLWCADLKTGAYVAIPIREVRHFATAGQALQAFQRQQETLYTGSNLNR